MEKTTEFFAETRAQWRAWLVENHLAASGVWLFFNKKSSGKPALLYEEAVEEALCFGWIDSKPGTVDAERSKQYYSPRSPRSAWSGLNKARIERLIAEGKMAPRGLETVELAKRTGTWTALDAVEKGIVPDDLAAALRAEPDAERHFETFPPSARRAILDWIRQAKTEETRARRIDETARSAAQNIRANQWHKK